MPKKIPLVKKTMSFSKSSNFLIITVGRIVGGTLCYNYKIYMYTFSCVIITPLNKGVSAKPEKIF